MRTVVLVPFRGDGGWRDRAFEHVHRHLQQLPYELVVGDSGDVPFSFGRTFNQLADRPWDVAVLHDADSIVPLDNIVAAVDQVGPGITYPWNRLIGLTRQASKVWFRTGQIPDSGFRRQRPPGRIPQGGPRVVTRDLWETVKGFDPRFVGWGGEDDVFARCAEILVAGPKRLDGTLVELWHPKQENNPDDPYYRARERNRRMAMEVRRMNPDELRAYVEQRWRVWGAGGFGQWERRR